MSRAWRFGCGGAHDFAVTAGMGQNLSHAPDFRILKELEPSHVQPPSTRALRLLSRP